MSGPVDVLAVMDKCHSSLECGGLRHSLSEARAAVAELIEAVRNWQEQCHGADADYGSRAWRRYDESCDRLDAALARVQGVSA